MHQHSQIGKLGYCRNRAKLTYQCLMANRPNLIQDLLYQSLLPNCHQICNRALLSDNLQQKRRKPCARNLAADRRQNLRTRLESKLAAKPQQVLHCLHSMPICSHFLRRLCSAFGAYLLPGYVRQGFPQENVLKVF